MSIDEDTIRQAVETYVGTLETGPATDILALYADAATLEDPVGRDVLRGKEQIGEFYAALETLDQTSELLMCRVVGSEALFNFILVTKTPDMDLTLNAFVNMQFDDDGKIAAMRAYWGSDDLVIT